MLMGQGVDSGIVCPHTSISSHHRTTMEVFLCADAAGRYCWIRGSSIDQIEDAGLEVVECQTSDFEGDSAGTMTLEDLKDSNVILFEGGN